MRKVRCLELKLDFDLYPRQQIDSYHVGQLAEALRAGTELPPVVADKKSRRVVDGFHRIKARLRVFGEEAETEVVEKRYRTDKELFLDAVRFNAAHGRILSAYDKAHVLLTAERLKVDPAAVISALHITQEAAAELRVSKSASGPLRVSPPIPIKRTIRHMAGKRLTKEQVAANERLGGMEQLFYVNQILTLIEHDLIDRDNEDLMAGLTKLHSELDGIVAANR